MMLRARMALQIEAEFVSQIERNLREVLPKAVAVARYLVDLKIWVISSVGSPGSEFADIAS